MGAAVTPEEQLTSNMKFLAEDDSRSAQKIEGFKAPEAGSDAAEAAEVVHDKIHTGEILDENEVDEILEENHVGSSDPVGSVLDENHMPIAGGASPSEASEIWPEEVNSSLAAGSAAPVAAPIVPTFSYYYIVKLPKHPEDRSDNSQMDDQKNKSQIIREAMNKKQKEKQELMDKIKPDKDVLKSILTEIEKKKAELRPFEEEIGSINKFEGPKSNYCRTIEELNAKIAKLDWIIAHETMTIKEEKKIMSEISTLNGTRVEVKANEKLHTEKQQMLLRKDELRKQMEPLQQEMKALMDKRTALRNVISPMEDAIQVLFGEIAKLRSDLNFVEAAKKGVYEKQKEMRDVLNSDFYENRDDIRKARALAAEGDKAAVQEFCEAQVERLMERWNNDPEFRKDYVKTNVASTLRRFRTLDGRETGPGEQPVTLNDVQPVKQVKEEKIVKSEPIAETIPPPAAKKQAPLIIANKLEEPVFAAPVVQEMSPEEAEALALAEKEKRRQVEMEKLKEAEARKQKRAARKEAKALQRIEKDKLDKQKKKKPEVPKETTPVPPVLDVAEETSSATNVVQEMEPVVEAPVSNIVARGKPTRISARTSVKSPFRKKRSLQRQVVDQLSANWNMIAANWKLVIGVLIFLIVTGILFNAYSVPV